MDTTASHTFEADLAARAKALLANENTGMQNAVLHKTEQGAKTLLFVIPEGETFPEHSTSRHALLHMVMGEATITVGDTTVDARPHGWLHIPPNVPHSLEAHTPFAFVLSIRPSE